MGDWLESYVKIMELDYWRSTPCKSASWDETTGRNGRSSSSATGKPVTMPPKHLVLATGMSGFPGDPALSRRRSVQGQAASFQPPHRRRGLGAASAASSSARTIRRTTSRPTSGSTAPTSPCCSARRRWSCARRRWRATGRSIRRRRWPAGITTEKADLIAASLPYALQPAAASGRCRADQARGCRLLRAAGRRRASSSPSARTRPASARCICAAARATTSTSARRS